MQTSLLLTSLPHFGAMWLPDFSWLFLQYFLRSSIVFLSKWEINISQRRFLSIPNLGGNCKPLSSWLHFLTSPRASLFLLIFFLTVFSRVINVFLSKLEINISQPTLSLILKLGWEVQTSLLLTSLHTSSLISLTFSQYFLRLLTAPWFPRLFHSIFSDY